VARDNLGEVAAQTAGAALLGVDLAEHIGFVIEALRPHARELGIQGRAAKGIDTSPGTAARRG
jgi:hypothetical protein